MRIGVNALYLIPGGVGGTEIYLRNLLIGMAQVDRANEYFVFTNRETGPDLVPAQSNFHYIPQPVRARIRPWRILWEQSGLPVVAARLKLDVLFNPGFTAPAIAVCPNVTVFHDLQHQRHPEYFRWFDLPFWKLLLWVSVRRSHSLIAVSEATRADLLHYYLADSTVVHHGVEPEFFRIAETREPGDYLLCVSTLHPHKNLDRLIRVHAAMKDAPRLVVTGLRGFAADRLEKTLPPGVQLTGWVPRKELYELYRRARGFVYPSKFEGFGMPVLEAMAAGLPVVCSNIPPLKEIAKDCAIFFNPEDDASLRYAITQLTSRSHPVDAGRKRAADFSWNRAALLTLRCLGAACGN